MSGRGSDERADLYDRDAGPGECQRIVNKLRSASLTQYQKYVDYIRNASKGKPLPIAHFDEDWEPVGPQVRRGMRDAGIIDEDRGHLILRSAS